MWCRGWKAADVIVRSEHDALFRGRGCERRVWARRLERVCGGREDIWFVLRRVVGRRRRSALRGGKRHYGHEVSILIRGARGARAVEGFDDDHPAAPTGATRLRLTPATPIRPLTP
jgi:hypothetical protein